MTQPKTWEEMRTSIHEGQYANRPALRPILDALFAAAGSLGGIEVRPARPTSRW